MTRERNLRQKKSEILDLPFITVFFFVCLLSSSFHPRLAMRDRCNSRNNVPSLAKLGRFSRDFIEFFCLFFFGFYFFRRPGSSWRSANSIGNNTADRTATVLRLRRRSPESKVDDARRLRSAIDGWEKKNKKRSRRLSLGADP